MRKLLCVFLLLTATALSATDRQPNADYHARRAALARAMDGGALILFAPVEPEGQNDLYGFRQEDNFYYLTGWDQSSDRKTQRRRSSLASRKSRASTRCMMSC